MRKHKRIATQMMAIVLTAALMLGMGVTAFAEEEVQEIAGKKIEYCLYNDTGMLEEPKMSSFYYSDSMLFAGADQLSPDLARVTVALSFAAYNEPVLKDMIGQMGFSVLNPNKSYWFVDNMEFDRWDHVAYTIGYKYLPQRDAHVFCVPIKGTGQNAEWFSDFDLGSEEHHKGFVHAANEVYVDLKEQMQSIEGCKAENTVILLTGHSRGAAIANLIGGWLTSNGQFAQPENIYCYTYACPNVSRSANPEMKNIFNFNNPGDLIPLLPGSGPGWAYKRNGFTWDVRSVEEMYDITQENLEFQFRRLTNDYYAGRPTSEGYQTLIDLLVPTVEAYENPKLQLVIYLVAYALGGKTSVNIDELLLKKFAMELAAEELDEIYADPVKWATEHLDGEAKVEKQECTDLQSFLKDELEEELKKATGVNSLEEIKDMSPEEFQAMLENMKGWMEEKAKQIAKFEELTGKNIEDQNVFSLASDLLQMKVDEIEQTQQMIEQLGDLFLDPNGFIGDSIAHAHLGETYVLWINSLFYGHDGWCQFRPSTDQKLDVVLNEKYTFIGDGCFDNCAALGSLWMPDTVLYLGESLCNRAENLESVRLPAYITEIKAHTFAECTSLSGDLVIPAGVTEIGSAAFYRCYKLSSLTLPACIPFTPYNGKDAFGYCSGLKKITLTGSGPMAQHYDEDYGVRYTPWGAQTTTGQPDMAIIIEDGITSIPDKAFRQCSNIASVEIPESVTSIGTEAFAGCTALVQADLPSQLESIGGGAFSNCSSLKALVIPETMTRIETDTFNNCSSLSGDLVIPTSVKSVGERVFYNCRSLESVSIPAHINFTDYDGDSAFDSCSNLRTFRITGSGPMGTYYENQIPWVNATTVIIEDGVTSIPQKAFNNCKNLKSVEIPDSVTTIGANAFVNCSALESVTLPSQLKKIEEATFYGCTSLQMVTLSQALTDIGKSAFYQCSSLAGELVIPENVRNIETSAFYGCSKITGLSIPAGVNFTEYVGKNAFERCTGLREVRITGSGAMGTYEANYLPWKSVTQVVIEEGVTSVSANAFSGCSLVSIVIPKSVTTIGNSAFLRCNSLNTVSYGGTEAQWNAISIGSNNASLTNAVRSYNGETVQSGFMGAGNEVRWMYFDASKEVRLSGQVNAEMPVYCVGYKGDQVVSVQSITATDGSASVDPSADSVKLFRVDVNWIPLSAVALITLG